MIYVKALIVGAVSGLLLAVLWVFTALWLPVNIAILRSYWQNEGIGGASATVGSGSIILAGLVGFAAGSGWSLRRESRRHNGDAPHEPDARVP